MASRAGLYPFHGADGLLSRLVVQGLQPDRHHRDVSAWKPIHKHGATCRLLHEPTPYRSQIDPTWTLEQFILEFKRLCLQVHEHSAYPLQRIMQFVRQQSSGNIQQASFTEVPSQLTDNLRLGDVMFEDYDLGDKASAEGGLTLYFSHGETVGYFTLEYDVAQFEHSEVEEMMQRWQRLMHLVFVPESRAGCAALCSLDLLLPEERRQILGPFRGEVVAYEGPATLKEVVEDQVDRTPGRVALEFEERSLTYGELEARSNRLAAGGRVVYYP